VQEMPKGPGNGVDSELANALAAACPDRAAGSLLADEVHPRNKHQDASSVICNSHASFTKHHELVSKAHREENAAGRDVFLRSTGGFPCLVTAAPPWLRWR
jgi:hypothetical protein